jgi:glycosyltransferase involved in cell wall biosynthesis
MRVLVHDRLNLSLSQIESELDAARQHADRMRVLLHNTAPTTIALSGAAEGEPIRENTEARQRAVRRESISSESRDSILAESPGPILPPLQESVLTKLQEPILSVLQEPVLPERANAELPGRKATPRDPDRAIQAVADFAAAFPERPDKLTEDDVRPYLPTADSLRGAFEQYDIIQYYSTHPLYGYLAGDKPYVALEHGTLRSFTMDDNPLHRLTALGYRKADHVFITNGDCLDYARRLGVTKFSPMIHPIDVDAHRREHGMGRDEMKRRLNADVLFFCPLRHDWAIKGTDIHIRALPMVRARVSGRVVLVLIRWGSEVAASRTLIAENRCGDCVVWTPPLSRITLFKLMQAADVVLDQIALPHFGATAPQALAAGTPVISSYEPESTSWIVDEPAPILPAFTAEDVAEAVMVALDPKWRAEFNDRARHWVDAQHHQDRVIAEHLRVYQDILERRNDGP